MEKSISRLLCLICLLSSCVPGTPEESVCIEPETTFAFRADQHVTPYPGVDIPPASPWVLEESIPLDYPELLAVRKLGHNTTEFWIWNDFEEENSSLALHVFRSDTSEWRTVALDDNLPGIFSPILALHVLPDNSVWAVHNLWATTNVVILGKYDETTETIKPVRNLIEVRSRDDTERPIVLLDNKKSIFWFLVPYGFIYSYDPSPDVLTRHISISDLDLRDAAITQNGDIYILNDDRSLEQTNVLFLYSPQTKTIEPVFWQLEPQPYYGFNLLADHADRLWFGSFGWMESEGIWYQLLRSPLFVTTNLDLGGPRTFRWLPPRIMLESPNNVFWFSGPNGLFSLDFNKGEWCWVSTFRSNIVQDSDGNLWIIGDGKVYRHPLLPR